MDTNDAPRCVLITGSLGLIGSACARKFLKNRNTVVVGVDDDSRRQYFHNSRGSLVREELSAHRRYHHVAKDICSIQWHEDLLSKLPVSPDLVIHCAGQPSHDWSGANPIADFDVNARATVVLLESLRRHGMAQHYQMPVFIFMSTNKVYGDVFNGRALQVRAIDERPLEPSCRSPFGVSKAAADLMVQEYGRYFGLETCCLRLGCVTGAEHAGVESHGFLSYVFRCVARQATYTIYGFGGNQIRDIIHADDVAFACQKIWSRRETLHGQIYNLGGGRHNQCTVNQALAAASDRLGISAKTLYVDVPRKGDHLWWITDSTRFRRDHPEWHRTRTLDSIYDELADAARNEVEHAAAATATG